jgi:uncharacterized protein
MNRKQFIQATTLAAAGSFINLSFTKAPNNFETVRVPFAERKFTSPAIEELIKQVHQYLPKSELAWLFENCFPNTLDTTVDFEIINGQPDTFVITGDIDAMWLRDSTAQITPYLPFINKDEKLKELVKGVINRQVKCITKDPYANAFYKDETKISEWKNDLTKMLPGVHERKWEIDSLCYPIRLSYLYYKQTNDVNCFTSAWQQAMQLILQTFTEQQRWENQGPYSFQRTTAWATDGLPLAGYGYPTKPTGLINSMFRPSDDATIFPYLIPSNYFALNELKHLLILAKAINSSSLLQKTQKLINTLQPALKEHGEYNFKPIGKIIPFEVNGFGSVNLMDDANVPSLLSMGYLLDNNLISSQLVKNTRAFAWSKHNPFFYEGKAGKGIGGPHVGVDYIWPLSIIMYGLTAYNNNEITQSLQTLLRTHAGTGFMHEAFHKNDAAKYTRKWFAWANTLFGELVYKTFTTNKALLKTV